MPGRGRQRRELRSIGWRRWGALAAVPIVFLAVPTLAHFPGAACGRLPRLDCARGAPRGRVDRRVHRLLRPGVRRRDDPPPIDDRRAQGARGDHGASSGRAHRAGDRHPVGGSTAGAERVAGPVNDRLHNPDHLTECRRARNVRAGPLARLARGPSPRAPDASGRRRSRRANASHLGAQTSRPYSVPI